MAQYVGIDLGTTNSAICSFDGENLVLYKSPEQHDVTPSAIFFDKRGNKFVGTRAYNNAARNPDNAATLFKRLMGTSTPVKLSAVEKILNPEECSAEVLKVLFGYLPEDIRENPDTGTVITVPAAFNQMQKDATMAAAEMAGIGKVALMQEPVAAVMSVMRQRKSDGIFLIYDLGGGTLDIAIAESIAGRVSLLAHGGIAMCGGRDFDRVLLDNVVKPWLHENFSLAENFTAEPKYRSLLRLAAWASEKAKMELSQRDEANISLSETELAVTDDEGSEIYLDIPINRDRLNELINPKLEESIAAARETLEKAGLSAHDVERVVFVGGPTFYKPLRDKVAFELGIAASTDVNPMTAVAEGASVFAESIDWETKSRGRKQTRGQVQLGEQLDLSLNYPARTPDSKAKISINAAGSAKAGFELQIDSLDTGWSSGRIPLSTSTNIELPISKSGENAFKIFVFDSNGAPVNIENNKVVITRTAATIDAIPSSSSIGIEVLSKVGGRPILDYLVKEGEPLPKKGKKSFRAAESLRADGPGALNFKLWEGDIEDKIDDNRRIGALSIKGSDFDEGVIAAGAELICEYEILDSGHIQLEVTVPSIGGSFRKGNFYSRQDAQIDFSTATEFILEEAENTLSRIKEVNCKVNNNKLDSALEKLNQAFLAYKDASDPEAAKQAMDNVLEAKKLLAQVRKEHLKEIRQLDLDKVEQFFNDNIAEFARATEISSFANLVRTAQRAIDTNSPDFENHLDELRGRNFQILWRQDWFVVDHFKRLVAGEHRYTDKQLFAALVAKGEQAIQRDDIDKLREVVGELNAIRFFSSAEDELLLETNIIRS